MLLSCFTTTNLDLEINANERASRYKMCKQGPSVSKKKPLLTGVADVEFCFNYKSLLAGEFVYQ